MNQDHVSNRELNTQIFEYVENREARDAFVMWLASEYAKIQQKKVAVNEGFYIVPDETVAPKSWCVLL